MMVSTQTVKRSRLLALLAGLMDFATGLGLCVAPALTLRLMQVAVPGEEALAYVRFVGVFVGGVGFSYLGVWWGKSAADLRAVFRFTIPFRLAAGTFCAVAVAVGEWSPMWLSVTVADGGLMALQTWLLRGDWGIKS